MALLRALIHSDDPAADSLVVLTLAFGAALIVFEGWDVFVAGHDFNAIPFTAACAALLGGLSGAKRLRGES